MEETCQRRHDVMRQYKPEELNVDTDLIDETPIKGEVNVESLVFRQIERTSLSALQDETIFASNVRVLLSHLPSHKRAEVINRSDEYTSTVQRLQYKHWCGVPLGTLEEPINGSPELIEEEVIDWHKLFEIIIDAFESCGVTWQFDKWTIEVGAVGEEKSFSPPSPVFSNTFEEQTTHPTKPLTEQSTQFQVENDTKTKRKLRPCAICGRHVEKGTGVFYLHKVVHKKECLDIAKVKWKEQSPNE